jgi:cytochrome c
VEPRELSESSLRFSALFTAAAILMAPSPLLAQSAAKGKTAFAQCAACHGTKAGEKKLGPSMAGVVGRKAGVLAGLSAPSPALAKYGKTWTAKELNAFLAAPAKTVPGTRMTIAVPDKTRRADIIAYLATLK